MAGDLRLQVAHPERWSCIPFRKYPFKKERKTVVGIKRKMRRPLVSRVYMYKKSHRVGFLRHLQQLRKPFLVSSVSQS
ncbi:hypothetical protein HJG60_009085 [Phyllostomus discolor]|uniref:Uncharacterized protein n=1 Tax=Phyllostomus discolor TaxID=89673 RepID=A0A834DH79_9CHIR|nr:hypothetical protein HJG60_009085 [Phyllostomus discolor]